MNKSILCIASSLLFSIAACDAGLGQTSSSLTAEGDGGVLGDGACGPRGPHGRPPPEAIAACDGLDVGAACSFTHDGGTLSGVCHGDPRGEGPNACGPDGPPPGDHRGPPPPEAIAACDGLEVGAACSFTHDGGTLSGVCHADPRGEGPNACGPDGPPPGELGDGGEHRGPPPEAIAACADLAVGASCSFTAPDGHSIEGTCEAGPSTDLPNACRPANAPPPPPSAPGGG